MSSGRVRADSEYGDGEGQVEMTGTTTGEGRRRRLDVPAYALARRAHGASVTQVSEKMVVR